MTTTQPYLDTIKTHYPDLQIDSARLNHDGQYNHVLILNDSLVFRFAKVPDAIAALRREIAVLQHLQGRLPLPVPDPQYTNFEPEAVGQVFMGYPLLPGQPLWRNTFHSITDPAAKKNMAAQLANFLRELHRVSPDAIDADLPNSDQPESWADMYRRIQDNLFPQMRPDARRQVAAHFEAYLDDPEQYAFTPCLRHGDFGTGNLLHDPESLAISGIIDFGFTALGDPAADFAGLFICYGEAFYNLCAAAYPAMQSTLKRVKFYCGTFALQEALFGFENDDQAAYQAGMETYV
jgi:aminoglycoside 2''-phosphotransferase